MGQYIINSPAGIRTHPYSTSATVNPLKYGNIATLNEVHSTYYPPPLIFQSLIIVLRFLDIGEIWANLLHNIYAALVAQYGWSPDARTNPDGTEGNIVHMHLFIDALPLQPCNPTLCVTSTFS
jgi:extracellular elastinolytic metalloproteinase